ncbi:hypothetical protein H257_08150 [Aphanomyces astaci]|uniref:Uncharacterized protein n=1 Tax=Aphanomyces astaci TaxID=112090 RepID=W4GFZ9_APHAT|nr:hypothetical protein H257_08150 [Aphanomyces astaci]ETV77903.1 hypothetical protein H257_08150 [Aphanomyces astaci]|eukprot:XP_009832240.1 hypothetical protein H257_08150 [Aphanomyces astaci]
MMLMLWGGLFKQKFSRELDRALDAKISHNIEGTWGVPLKAIRTFLYHLAGFGLKLDRAAMKIYHVGHALGTVQDNLRRVLPSLQTHALVILADETLSHAMIASPSANGSTLTDASGIYSIEKPLASTK